MDEPVWHPRHLQLAGAQPEDRVHRDHRGDHPGDHGRVRHRSQPLPGPLVGEPAHLLAHGHPGGRDGLQPADPVHRDGYRARHPDHPDRAHLVLSVFCRRHGQGANRLPRPPSGGGGSRPLRNSDPGLPAGDVAAGGTGYRGRCTAGILTVLRRLHHHELQREPQLGDVPDVRLGRGPTWNPGADQRHRHGDVHGGPAPGRDGHPDQQPARQGSCLTVLPWLPESTPMPTREAQAALEHASSVPLWCDDSRRPQPRAAYRGDHDVDLAVVGGGFTGLWAALLALEEDPGREVVVLEGARLGWAATGRNGGFCSSSLTHGVGNGLARWPQEMPLLQRLGAANLDAIEATIGDRGIDCDFERTGELDVALEPWQLEDLRGLHRTLRDLGQEAELLSAAQTRALVRSPTYLGGLLDRRGVAMVNPARLAWGLADAIEDAGGRIHEATRVLRLRSAGERVALITAAGTVRARQVVLATNVFPSPLRRARAYVVPVWDHLIATEPLSRSQREALGWEGRSGVGDSGNQFHYYRLTSDNRLVFGGYDALYYYGSDLSTRRARRPETEQMLYRHMVKTFPGLQGVRITHTWGGAIDLSL